ncbi:type IV pilus modification PilV family protein [Candidatus Nitrospira bockiana]
MDTSYQPRRHANRSHTGDEGFTLLEGMFAAVVLAIGLLALAGMQGISLGRNVDANELTLATNLSADMMERIQFNRRNASLYNNIDTLVAGTRPADGMAGGDFDQWLARLQGARLSNPQGRVQVTPIGPTNPPLNQNQVVVQVSWQSSQASSSILRQRNVTLTAVVARE